MRPGSPVRLAWESKLCCDDPASGRLCLAELVDPLLVRGHPLGRMGQRRVQFSHQLLLIGTMGPLDLAVELRGFTFDAGMTDAVIFDMPAELGLELMAIAGPDFLNPERELFDDVIDEVLSVGLCVFVADLERPDASCIIDSGLLEPADFFAALASEGEELAVHLDVMARHLLVVALGVDFAQARSAWAPANAIAAQNACYVSVRDFDVVIARQVPDDPDRSEVIFAS